MTGRVRRHLGEIGGLAGPRARKSVSLALQGGGAHGAFTWGVLDALLEDGRLAVEAITGASAGAMNAVVMEGWLGGGIDGARSQLETFWRRASFDGSLTPAQRSLLGRMLGFWSIQAWTDVIAQRFSPSEMNPLNINPLRDAVDALIDFNRVRARTDVEIFISATNVWTGKVAISGDRGSWPITSWPPPACRRSSRPWKWMACPNWTVATWAIRPCSRSSTRR